MKNREHYRPVPLRKRWQTIAIVGALVAGCGTVLGVLSTWVGAGTTKLTAGEAWDVIHDPEQPGNRKQLAATQLFRLAEDGGSEAAAAELMLRELGKRNDTCGEHARRHLKKLDK